jgi:hypothetical protein
MVEITADMYSPDIDYNKMEVDELVQRLEAMEKNNEQIKRENQLFESYIIRKRKDETQSHDEKASRLREIRKRYGENLVLNPERKYDIASLELTALKANIDEGRTKSETLLERLKAILEGTDISIADIRKEAFDFGRFLSSAENGRLGKYDAEKLSKYMYDKLLQKEANIDKLTSKNVTLKVAILRAESNIKSKDEMGDDLKFIDFHQMQIQNKKHIEDIEDRNDKLLKFKNSSANVSHTLNKLKTNLEASKQRADEIRRDMETKQASLLKKEEDIIATEFAIKKANELKKKQLTLKSTLKEMPVPLTFVKQKNECIKQRRDNKDWNRKIEIAEFEAKKARAVLRKRDREMMHA